MVLVEDIGCVWVGEVSSSSGGCFDFSWYVYVYVLCKRLIFAFCSNVDGVLLNLTIYESTI